MCPSCSDLCLDSDILKQPVKNWVNWASLKPLDNTSSIRLSKIQGWGAEAALALQLERRGTKGVEVSILTWFDLVHAPTEGWWLPLLEGVILLLFLSNAALHVWLHPQLREQLSLSRALAQAKQAAEPQLCRCSQESAARSKCLLCLCLEKAHEENVTHSKSVVLWLEFFSCPCQHTWSGLRLSPQHHVQHCCCNSYFLFGGGELCQHFTGAL